MNERIRELAKQADPEYTGNENDDMGHALVGDEAIQKFAELIVEESCRALTPMLRDMISRGQAVDLIKKHFGIEE